MAVIGSPRMVFGRPLLPVFPSDKGGGALGALALDDKVVFLGDSNTERAMNISSSVFLTETTIGYPTWVLQRLGCRLGMPPITLTQTPPTRGGNLGLSGDTAAQIAARVGSATALTPKVCFVLMGTNSVGSGVSASAILGSVDTTIAALRAAGVRMVFLTIPIKPSTDPWTTPQNNERLAANLGIKARLAADLLVVDSDLFITSNADFLDNIHTGTLGAKKLGWGAADVLIAAGWLPTTDATTLWAAPATLYTANLALSGTGGAVNAATGQVANNHTLDASGAGGATVAGTNSGAGPQIITLSGAKTGTGAFVDFTEFYNATKPAANDTVEGFIDFEITTALTNVRSINLVTQLFWDDGGGYGVKAWGESAATGADTTAFPLGVGRYQFPTGKFKVPPNIQPSWPFFQNTHAFINFIDGSVAVGGVIKIYKKALRKAA